MRNHFIFLAAAFAVASAGTATSQELVRNMSVTGVCYAGSGINRIYIPPPLKFFSRAKGKHASVRINYSDFPADAVKASEYAASILESVLPADARVLISASWERITATGVLANSSITGYAGGWSIDALNPGVLYPVALAEKIAGKAINDSTEADITLRVNNAIDWYLGTDGNTARTRYDLVTIILHEVCHGLGFFDSMNSNGSTGWYGINNFPLIYDTFIEDSQGNRLTDTLRYANHSANLSGALTGGALYFHGPLLSNYSQGARARIYAPSKWDSGSSVSHLDENTTMNPADMLMTPFIQKGEAIHDPGKLTMSMLGDLGWVNTRIIHKRPHDTEQHISSIDLNVSVISDTAYDHSYVGAVYSFDDFSTRDTVYLQSASPDNAFSTSIGIPSFNSRVSYYFFSRDVFGRLYNSPALRDSGSYSVYIGTDTSTPMISHVPLTSLLEKVDTIIVAAVATDNLGLDTVYAEYRVNEGAVRTAGMFRGADDRFLARIPARGLKLKGGDSLQYRIVARDSARTSNTAFLPQTGYFSVPIEGLLPVLTEYSTDFTGSAADQFINDGFDVASPDGFSVFGLNTRHPYESPEDNGKTIEYTSILRHPLKLGSSGLTFTYNEVVLVEPGETGSVFGSDSFYDYVVVDGSADFGKTWHTLTDGYDSGFRPDWKTIYNSSVSGDNSTAVPGESALHRHSFHCSPSQYFLSGDTLLIRFRLFSDPFANGWGWFLSDLFINQLVDGISELHPAGTFTAYPNPGSGHLWLRSQDDRPRKGTTVRCNVYSASGQLIIDKELPVSPQYELDLSGHPAGLYMIVLYRDDWIETIRYSLVR